VATTLAAVLLENVRVFDGHRTLSETSVLLRDGVIVQLGADGEVSAPSGCERVDGTGQTLLPGLIDAHTHVFPGSLEQALMFGVTTELDMFASPTVVAELKAQAARLPDMADVRSAGCGATAPGGHPSRLVDRGFYLAFPTIETADQTEQFVADRLVEGSDYLKVFIEPGHISGIPLPTLDAETVRALRSRRRPPLRQPSSG